MLAVVIGSVFACEAIEGLITPYGFTVERAGGAAEASERLEREPGRLVVLEWQREDAAEACRALVREQQVVVALSTERDPERLAEIFAAGALDVFRLPDDAARLLARALAVSRGASASARAGAQDALFRTVFERNPVAACLFDSETLRFLAVTDGAVRQYGWSREELLELTLRDIRPPEAVAALEEALRSPAPSYLTTTHRRKDGSELVSQGIFQRFTVDGREVSFAISRDVSEEVRTLEAQRRALADYKAIVERSADGVLTHRIDGTILYVNPAFVAFLGYADAAELVGRSVLELVHPEDRAPGRARFEGIAATGQATTPRASRFLGRDGTVRWGETRGILASYDGAPALTALVRDLNDRRRAEEALRASEERFSRLFHTSPAGIAITRLPDGRFVDVNDRFTELTGFERAEVIGRTGLEIGMWADPNKRGRMYEQASEGGGCPPMEVRFLTRSGRAVDVLLSAVVVQFGGEPCVVSHGLDISELKRLDEQLRQATKMEAIGRLAGGVAHDFNNLLTGIRGYSEILVETLGGGSAERDAARHIHRAALRAASLTEQLLIFTRRTPHQPRVVVLDEGVRQTGALLRRIIGGDIALELSLEAGGARVRIDPAQLEQVVLNLAINARDAMPSGGQLTIATTAGVDGDGRGWVRLTFTDDGVGMTEEVRLRIFEPFFTTKEVGRGTGLGLSIVYGIVEQSGGTLEVETAPGRGTRFEIRLPRVGAPPDEIEPAASPARAPGGREAILVVEDEQEVRDFVVFVLERAGYHVRASDSGAGALSLAAARSCPFDLLLTDLVMPQMGGRELTDRFAALYPTVRVLQMSGYPGNALEPDQRGAEAFLQKPFSPEGLLGWVRRVLDSPAR